MSKKISKIFTYLLLTVLAVVGLGNVANSVAEAAGPKTSVVIHKIETDATAAVREYDISQPITNLGDYFGPAAEPLEGVSFTWYKVDDATKYAEMIATPGDYATTADVVKYLGADVTGTRTGETKADGEVTINLADGNYWVVENTKGTIKDSAAVPFGLTLPFTKADGTGYYEIIHVYPKNILEKVPVNPEKEVNEENVAIGDTNTWTISQVIPKGIEDYKTFTFVDEIDSRLDYIGNVEVSVEGVAFVDGDYTVVYTKAEENTDGTLIGHTISGTLTVVFTEQGRKNLANANANGPVVITFDTKVNDSAVMGEPINNNVELQFDNGHGTKDKNEPGTPPSVVTGGYKFQKLDGEAGLAGAEFIISREITEDEGVTSTTEYVQVVRDDDGAITEVNFIANKNGATKFGSADPNGLFESADSTGLFEIRGLPYGHYTLTEVKAPEGYALPTSPDTTFDVTENSFKGVQQKIQNKKITIPQTGGMGTAIFTVIGVVLMTISVVSYKRKSNA